MTLRPPWGRVMGSRAASFFASFWGDRENRKMSEPEKLLFIFLVSFNAPSGGSVSGVYECDVSDMEYHTGIPSDVCRAILTGREVKVTYEIGGERGDPERASQRHV